MSRQLTRTAATLAALLCVSASCASASNIGQATDQNFEKVVRAVFERAAKDDAALDELEDAASELRSTQARFANGELKLGGFYDVLNGYATTQDGAAVVGRWAARHPKSPAPDMLFGFSKLWIAAGNEGWDMVSAQKAQDGIINLELIGIIKAHMSETKDFNAADPYYYTLIARTHLLVERDDTAFDALIVEGLQRYPGFMPLLDAAADYYLPKWHGSSAELESAARKFMQHVPEDMRAAAYARIYLRAFERYYGVEKLRQSHIDWPTFANGARDLIVKRANAYYLGDIAMMSCVAGDRDKTEWALGLFAANVGGISKSKALETCQTWVSTPSWLYSLRTTVSSLWATVRSVVYAKTGIILPDMA